MNPLLKDIFAEARIFIAQAQSKSVTLATAESCTGGLFGAAITSISGASSVFMGGVMAYNNHVKTDLLFVPPEILERHGAVSSEVAQMMAEGVLKRIRADIGLSITGIAGPDGGTAQKPVGTVWIGMATPDETQAHLLQLGDIGRNKIRDVTVLRALKLLNKITT